MAENNRLNAAKLVRRTSLNCPVFLVDDISSKLDSTSWSQTVEYLINRPLDDSKLKYGLNDDQKKRDEYVIWWLDKIASTKNPLQEKMAFFWHGILTSDVGPVSGPWVPLLAIQLNTLREKSLTSYSEILHSFVKDGCLMRYLNAEANTASKPNENLARELMELFTFGTGNYSESDVRQAALAMSGWEIDKQTKQVSYNASRGYSKSTTFLGETKKWDLESITSRLLNDQATATRISTKIWYEFVGNNQAPSNLGSDWLKNNYDIRWILNRILNDKAFLESNHYVRPKSGFEYYMNAHQALGFEHKIYYPENLGQRPYRPPNVAGWQGGDRWLSPSSMLARWQLLKSIDYKKVKNGQAVSIEEVVNRCSIYDLSDNTKNILNSLTVNGKKDDNNPSLAVLRWWVALSSPESNFI